MPIEYVDLNTIKYVTGRIIQRTHSELFVYSPAHSSERRWVYFNFRPCAALGPLAPRLASEFVVWTSDKELPSARGSFIPVRAWLVRLAETVSAGNDSADCWPAERWRSETFEWWLSVRSDPDLKDTTKNQYRAAVRGFIGRLQTSNILPWFSFPKAIEKPAGDKKPTLANVRKLIKDLDGHPALDAITRSALLELDALDDLTDSAQVLRRIDLLLDATRRLVSRSIRDFWAEWQEVRRIVAAGYFDPEGFLRRYCVSRHPLKLKRGWRRELTDDTDMIALVEYLYDGIIPINEYDNPIVRWIYNQYPIEHFRSRLHSTPDSVLPFLVLMLLENPMEVSSAAELKTDALVSTQNPGNKRITYIKKRARHRTIYMIWSAGDERTLRKASTAKIVSATAFGCLLEMRSRLVPFAEPHEVGKLFLVLGHKGKRDTVRNISADRIIDAWDRLRSRDPLLARYRFTLDKIRPTLILRTYIVSGGNIFDAYRVAQHKLLSTTQRYVNENVSEFLSSAHARNVQGSISISVTKIHPDLRKLGLFDEKISSRILKKAENIGFMSYAGRRNGKIDSIKSEMVRFFTSGQIFIVEDINVASEIVAFKAHLLAEAATLRTHPDYETSWLPLLVFLNAALEAMSPDIRKRGHDLASRIQIEYLEPPHV